MKIKRVFHHYLLCEEYSTNMWKSVPPKDKKAYQNKSVDLMLDCCSFLDAMIRVINEWPHSCEAAISASTVNHQAWFGHAACAINHNAPEDITRLAWRELTEQQQDDANEAADMAIAMWKEKYMEAQNA